MTSTELVDTGKLDDARLCLMELGSKLSDVFGADQILWVEGPTECDAFERLMSQNEYFVRAGISILPVRATGDFESRRPCPKLIWEIYERLSSGNALIPPAIAFIFDREGRSEQQLQNLSRDSGGKLRFLERRMYENYLIHPKAISYALDRLPTFQSIPVDESEIEKWILQHGLESRYYAPTSTPAIVLDASWLREVHAGKLLGDLFDFVSEHKEKYSKTRDSICLTQWIMDNEPDYISGLGEEILSSLELKDQ
jgi:hypothetical protein